MFTLPRKKQSRQFQKEGLKSKLGANNGLMIEQIKYKFFGNLHGFGVVWNAFFAVVLNICISSFFVRFKGEMTRCRQKKTEMSEGAPNHRMSLFRPVLNSSQ